MVEVVSMADRIRRYARERWVEPVREAGRAAVSIRAADLARDMGLSNRVAAVAVRWNRVSFLREAGRRLVATALETKLALSVRAYQHVEFAVGEPFGNRLFNPSQVSSPVPSLVYDVDPAQLCEELKFKC